MRRLVIFAHYDPRSRVKRHVEHHLRALREIADTIWFVSSATLPPEELEKASALADRAWTRDNVGFDFGMWREALESVDVEQWDELVLTNSSVFGPVFPLSEAFTTMDPAKCDVWAMTDNVEHGWHLQSYFLVARASWLHSESFRRFWNGVEQLEDKISVIQNYEIGLSRFLAREGFEAEALVRIDTLPPRPLRHWLSRPGLFNPTLVQPLSLLERRMPYVKVELIRDNPMERPLGPILRALSRAGFDRSLLEVDVRP
jgi:rhamnosyltransferase